MTATAEFHERLRRYYTGYYRDTLGIPDWATLVDLRDREEHHEQRHLARLSALLGSEALRGRVLNVGCGTGGFNEAAAAAGACVVGVDDDAEAMAIRALRRPGGFARAAAEALPFRDGVFDLVYCYSVIEHVASGDATIREMVRVTRPGEAIDLHTPNGWSSDEGHHKLFWAPFLPRAQGQVYVRLRSRRVGYLAALRRLTPRAVVRAFQAAGATELTFHCDDQPRETLGRLRALAGAYYRLSGIAPFIEVVARKP